MRAAKEMNLTLLPECHCVEKWYWFDPHQSTRLGKKGAPCDMFMFGSCGLP